MITLKDVAKYAGVSEGTASLALNNKKGVNAETRRKVLEAAKKMGYHPNVMARGLATRKTNTVGLIVTEIENPFFASLTRYIHEYVRNAGYKLIVSISNEDLAQEEEILEEFIEGRAEAVIVVPTLAKRTRFEIFDTLKRNRIPCIFATAYYPGYDQYIDCVMTNLEEGMYQLTKYLLDLNHRSIFFATVADLESVPFRDRLNGLKRAISEYGSDGNYQLKFLATRADFQSGYNLGRSMLNMGLPDAIIALNDILALGISAAVREGGYKVPEDISICGYDDVVFSSLAEIPLTTVRQDIEAIAREITHLTVKRITGIESPYEIIRLQPDLVVRRSTTSKKNR